MYKLKSHKLLIICFILIYLCSNSLIFIADDNIVNSSDICRNNQTSGGQLRTGSPRNLSQSFFQGRDLWIVVIIVIILFIIIMYVLITKSLKDQMKKNTALIQQIIHDRQNDDFDSHEHSFTTQSLVEETEVHRVILKILNYNENQVMKKLIEHDGIVLQSEISRIPNMGKVKAHRVLQDLELKGIVKKEPFGKTNRIILQDIFKTIFLDNMR